MDVNVESKRTVEEAGDFICTEENKLFVLAIDPDEKYPYLLISLQSFQVVQNYDCLPTREELEEDIGEEIKDVYNQQHASITLI